MRNKSGFTLIEVLIALTILSIALMAIIKSTSQQIRDTHYIQDKTTATWVATNVMNEIRAGILTLPSGAEHVEQKTEMLGQEWTWQAKMISTGNPHIKEIDVSVSSLSQENIISLVSYIYAAQ